MPSIIQLESPSGSGHPSVRRDINKYAKGERARSNLVPTGDLTHTQVVCSVKSHQANEAATFGL